MQQAAYDGTRLWVSDSKAGSFQIHKMNLPGLSIEATVSLPQSPDGVAFDGTAIWVTQFSGSAITAQGVRRIDVATNSVTDFVALLFGGVFYSPTDCHFAFGDLWVAGTHPTSLVGRIFRINTSTKTVIASIPSANNSSSRLTDDGTLMWMSSRNSSGFAGGVTSFDPATNLLNSQISQADVGNGPLRDQL